ncbi:hypothetical protein I316_06896 [Kwoniella heveanensis BCC8398]|uniref:Uncharacterized protein n=1 Tax=Kwoniella heveanensis BCC8398 TaxID=1296120 RepID=A0A1B9GKL1_9TREE|nr:hypothetical protein I316_06896 [Kwoniella heveanensis BCC8398]
MHFQALFAILPFVATLPFQASGAPVALINSRSAMKREVPQEKSHDKFLRATQDMLQLDNPQGIVDPVFGLLGNAAASAGQGSVTNTDCLQQATADQAFTNAKAAGDVGGMTAALVYRALERNTGGVGVASVLCTETPVNPEIAALSQHQDPASPDAATTNKAITLALAQQIASIGEDPLIALESGTFAPGDVGDATGKGNSCDDPDCIFEGGRLVEDATADEIDQAVAGITPATGATGTAAADAAEDPAGSAVTDSGTGGCPAVFTGGDISVGAGTDADTGATGDEAADTAAPPANNAVAAEGIDIGQCTDFSLTFAGGLDNRAADEFTFQPTDLVNFNHGSALNPSIITQFMCDTFVNACARSATTRDVCKTVAADLDAQLQAGQLARDQGFADAWLTSLESAFGIQSTNTGTGDGNAAGVADDTDDTDAGANGNVDADADAGNADDAGTAADHSTDVNAGDDAAADADAGADADTTLNAGATGTAEGENLQTFASALNGVAATPVLNVGGDRPFQVKGDTFVNAGAAFQRSCDQQFNGCANAANSGQGDASVSDCSAQKDQCSAATPAA